MPFVPQIETFCSNVFVKMKPFTVSCTKLTGAVERMSYVGGEVAPWLAYRNTQQQPPFFTTNLRRGEWVPSKRPIWHHWGIIGHPSINTAFCFCIFSIGLPVRKFNSGWIRVSLVLVAPLTVLKRELGLLSTFLTFNFRDEHKHFPSHHRDQTSSRPLVAFVTSKTWTWPVNRLFLAFLVSSWGRSNSTSLPSLIASSLDVII